MDSLGKLENYSERLRRLVKEWLESGQHRVPDELAGVLKKDANRVLPPWPGILQRYKALALRLHLHVRANCLVGGEWKSGDVCAVVEHASSTGFSMDAGPTANLLIANQQAHMGLGQPRDRHIQGPVFIDVREFVDKPKGVISGVLPSVVRLQLLNECNRLNGHPVNVWSVDFLVERGVLKDWKARLFRGRSLVHKDELPREVVEAGAEVVQAIAQQYGQPSGRQLLHPQIKDGVLRLVISDELVEVGLQVLPDLVIESAQVFLSPDQFESHSIKRMRHEVTQAMSKRKRKRRTPKGAEIPILKHSEFMRNLKRQAKPESRSRRPKK